VSLELLLPVIGGLILLGLALDVFITVFQPEGHGGPLTRRQSNLLWRVWRELAPGDERRDSWLALAGPALALLTPAVWAVLLIVGYALVYFPWIESFLVSPGELRHGWVETLYYSGVVAATLGTGDVLADLPALRLLTVAEAISGFALLSAALSYILAVYRENGRKTTLASDLALHFPPGQDRGYVQAATARDRWLEEVARELLHVRQAHAQYPILHYFRPTDPAQSLALQLAPLVRLASSSHVADQSSGDGPAPGVALAGRALALYLAAADRRFIGTRADPDAEPATVENRYVRLLAYLGYGSQAE
jgi:hypothetical protein